MKWSAMIGASRQALRREAVLAALVHVFVALCRGTRRRCFPIFWVGGLLRQSDRKSVV